jgi:NAD(P)-dependent dehydrogenase (short-subunit alcohol dehydrogenase family)
MSVTTGRLAGKVAWISGGASGIGEGVARLFAGEGAAVAIADCQHDRAQSLATEITQAGGRAIACPVDVQNEADVNASIKATVEHFGSLSIVVNSAGIAHARMLHEYTVEEWEELMNINVRSIFLSFKHAWPHLQRQSRSYVTNIGSISSLVAQAGTPAYTTSKGAVLQLTRSIAVDYASFGLRCNCVCPGITDTPLLRYHLNQAPDPAAALASRLKRVPTGVILQPHDIAKAVLYFSCEDSAGVTGTSLVVDGGYLAAAEWQAPSHTAFMDP